MDFRRVKIGDPEYPRGLSDINNPPKNLYVRGDAEILSMPSFAIIGTRKATRAGIDLAERTAGGLASKGLAIVSGLAMGIDTAAHRGALSADGKTIAVLGNSIDTIYPAQNERLADNILKSGGCIVSEYGPGDPLYKGNFIQRNRIVSAMSLGVIVIEAPEKSGAIATAGFAGEQGKNVFVFPGQVNNKNYTGSHALIRDGAILVTGVSDILEDSDIETLETTEAQLKELTHDENTIIVAIRDAGTAISIDRIIDITTLHPQVVNGAIATLVISGIIKEAESGYELSNS